MKKPVLQLPLTLKVFSRSNTVITGCYVGRSSDRLSPKLYDIAFAFEAECGPGQISLHTHPIAEMDSNQTSIKSYGTVDHEPTERYGTGQVRLRIG